MMKKINYKLLRRIHKLGDVYIYVYKYRTVKYLKGNLICATQFGAETTWRTGKVIWSNKSKI